jgi:hypothetical protein
LSFSSQLLVFRAPKSNLNNFPELFFRNKELLCLHFLLSLLVSEMHKQTDQPWSYTQEACKFPLECALSKILRFKMGQNYTFLYPYPFTSHVNFTTRRYMKHINEMNRKRKQQQAYMNRKELR